MRKHNKFWSENVKRGDHLQELVYGRIISKCIQKELDMGVWTGIIWFRIRTSGGL
jgi:hypothetical protein